MEKERSRVRISVQWLVVTMAVHSCYGSDCLCEVKLTISPEVFWVYFFPARPIRGITLYTARSRCVCAYGHGVRKDSVHVSRPPCNEQQGISSDYQWIDGTIHPFRTIMWSTPDSNSEVIQAKWFSLEGHIHNKLKRHGNKHFPDCAHGR